MRNKDKKLRTRYQIRRSTEKKVKSTKRKWKEKGHVGTTSEQKKKETEDTEE